MHCLRNCFEDEDESEIGENSNEPPMQNSMTRISLTGETEPSCLPENSASHDQDDRDHLLLRFWNKLTKDIHYDQVPAHDSPRRNHDQASSELSTPTFGLLRRSSSNLKKSPLRTALSFDQSREIPSIKTEEVVLPGSALQQQMASKMCETIEEQGDECVICMDGFSPDNPRMPTMCGCGENKTYFHLPCLYQWVDQNEDCPACRETLLWEEF